MSTSSGAALATRDAIRLVAMREIRAKMFAKSFVVTTLATMAAILAGGILYAFLGSAEPSRIGVLPGDERAAAVVGIAAASDRDIEIKQVSSREAGEKKLEGGDLDVLLAHGDPGLTLVVDEELSDGLTTMFAALAQQEALAGEIQGLGGDPSRVGDVVAASAPTIERLNATDEKDGGQIFAGFAVGILIFMALMTTGQMVAQGVVEEKSSRVVELLLATVRPWQLMAGKVIGIGAVGLVQMFALVITGAATAVGFGLLDGTEVALGSTAAWALVWFVLGYASYALLMAGLAALVSRQEDIGPALAPVMMIMMVPYLIGVSLAPWDPDHPVVVALSYIPFAAPMLMPMRIALGDVALWEILVSAGLTVALLPALVWIAGRLYSRGILRTGARISLLDALRR